MDWTWPSHRAASTSRADSANALPLRAPSSAFSALDVRTDARVRAALREVSATATVLIVSQRISTVAEADQVVVVDDGMVVGIGTHAALLADCPIYAEFADSQAVAGSARPATSDSAGDAR